MSTAYEITGRLIVLNDTQTFGSGFTKREFVIETSDKYPQKIKLEAVKDGCDRLDAYRVGDEITVSFNLRGNEYQGKFYVQLQAWKLTGTPTGAKPLDAHNEAKTNGYQPQRAAPPAQMDEEDVEDDIPF